MGGEEPVSSLLRTLTCSGKQNARSLIESEDREGVEGELRCCMSRQRLITERVIGPFILSLWGTAVWL